jgi:tRNA(Leu) C34 or U34 (ribose-2'-O)-methylase TrmL
MAHTSLTAGNIMHPSTTTIGLVNPKTPENMGAVMRAAGCFDAQAILYTGERYDRAARFNTDTKRRSLSIPLTQVSDLLASQPKGATIVCVELVEGATPLPDFVHPENAFYIFGPEDGTLSQQLIDQADAVIYIPTTGCLNLAATVNVVLYDRTAKTAETVTGDARIRLSRDTNNRVKVRKSPAANSPAEVAPKPQ